MWRRVVGSDGVVGLIVVFCIGCAHEEEVRPVAKQRDESTRRVEPGREMTNSIGMKLVHIPAGEFRMGTTKWEIERWLEQFPGAKRQWFEAEYPPHRVRITKPVGVPQLDRAHVPVRQLGLPCCPSSRREVTASMLRSDTSHRRGAADGGHRRWVVIVATRNRVGDHASLCAITSG
jgi:hypothetical protein